MHWVENVAGHTPRRSTKREKKIKKNKKQGGKRLPFAMQAPEYRNRVGDDEYERRSIRLVRNGVGVRALQP